MYKVFEELCEQHGVKPSNVGKATGVSSAAISSWKVGRYTPKIDKLQRIADYFDVSLEYLLTGKEPQPTAESVVVQELLDAADGCSPEDIHLASDMLRRMKAYNRLISNKNSV